MQLLDAVVHCPAMQQTSSLGGTMLHPRAFLVVAESGCLAALRSLLQAARTPLRVALSEMASDECSLDPVASAPSDPPAAAGGAPDPATSPRALVRSLSVLLSRSFHILHQFAKRCKGSCAPGCLLAWP